MNPKISIVIPVYNVERYLDVCLKSILAQTFIEWECILVDDGSYDNSGIICDNYTKIDKRFVVIHQKNAGVSAARNRGLEIAQGEYIGFVDSDDWIEPKMFEQLYKKIVDNKADICISNVTVVNGEKKIRHKYKQNDNVYSSSELIDMLLMPNEIEGFLFTKLFKRSIIMKNDLRLDESIKYMEDTLFTYQYLQHIENGYLFSESFYNYRINDNSVTMQKKLPDNVLSVFDKLLFFENNEMRIKRIKEKKAAFIIRRIVDFKVFEDYVLPSNFPKKKYWLKYYVVFLFTRKELFLKKMYYSVCIFFPFVYKELQKLRGVK